MLKCSNPLPLPPEGEDVVARLESGRHRYAVDDVTVAVVAAAALLLVGQQRVGAPLRPGREGSLPRLHSGCKTVVFLASSVWSAVSSVRWPVFRSFPYCTHCWSETKSSWPAWTSSDKCSATAEYWPGNNPLSGRTRPRPAVYTVCSCSRRRG